MGPELGLLLKQTECEAGNQFGIFKFPSPGVLSVLGTGAGVVTGGHAVRTVMCCITLCITLTDNTVHYTLRSEPSKPSSADNSDDSDQ